MAEYEIPNELLYTREDEWVRTEDENVVIGITDYAQQQLGDIVFFELPEIGARIAQGEPFGVIESVKAVSDLYAPITGEVVSLNKELDGRPEAANEDCLPRKPSSKIVGRSEASSLRRKSRSG